MRKYKRNGYILICWKEMERSFDLKMDDKNNGIRTAYIMVFERECDLVYEAVS
jgi:hypothetical protein